MNINVTLTFIQNNTQITLIFIQKVIFNQGSSFA